MHEQSLSERILRINQCFRYFVSLAIGNRQTRCKMGIDGKEFDWKQSGGKKTIGWEKKRSGGKKNNRVGKKQSGGNSIPRENLNLGKPLSKSHSVYLAIAQMAPIP